MNLASVMDAVAARLGTITGLRVTAYPDGQINVPAAIVTMPSALMFDETYGRGADRMNLPVVVLVSGTVPRAARNALGAYASAVGAKSIKAVLEGGTYAVFDTLRVTGVQFDVYQVGAVAYPAAIFDLDIYGSGTS